uniref:Uncharacterized protein n=1 Tax=Strix occidentalis caurina TaxID=311401 RepID=A0A8D0FUX0_STROC
RGGEGRGGEGRTGPGRRAPEGRGAPPSRGRGTQRGLQRRHFARERRAPRSLAGSSNLEAPPTDQYPRGPQTDKTCFCGPCPVSCELR